MSDKDEQLDVIQDVVAYFHTNSCFMKPEDQQWLFRAQEILRKAGRAP